MVFSAPTFLFIFLPVVLLLALASPKAWRNAVLLLASLFFYTWGEGGYVLLMLASIAFNYCAGRLLDRGRGDGNGQDHGRDGRQWLLAAGVGGNLILLAWFKYAGFLGENLAAAFVALGAGDLFPALSFGAGLSESIHLPIGISFFTFQAISYLVDVYRGEHPAQRNPIDLALYIALFPQLIAGPIVRYQEIRHALQDRIVDLEGFAEGIRRFTTGLAKKLLIANPLGIPVDTIFALPANELTPSVAWFGSLCYALQIYFDFSGYSDMAIGLGRFFGFTFPENFNRPYRALSMTDFWRRWHLSLSRWFKDYLYIPLGGNRGSTARTYLNLFIVFTLCGLWHGASWNFLAWGLFHGAFLVLERSRFGVQLAATPRSVQHLYCLLAVLASWVLFRSATLPDAGQFLFTMTGLARFTNDMTQPMMIADAITMEVSIALLAGIVWAGGLLEGWQRLLSKPVAGSARPSSAWFSPSAEWASTPLLLALWFALGMKLATRTYDPFLYFRF